MTHIVLTIIMAAIALAISRRAAATVISAALTFVISYFGLPTLSWGFWGIIWTITLTVTICLIQGLIISDDYWDYQPRWIGVIIGVIVMVFILIVIPIFTGSLFHANSYHGLLGSPKPRTYATDTSPVDLSQIRIVDQAVADRLGDKKLGEQPALGSQVNIGTMNIQQVNGQLYWVAPLNHSGFFKWLSNGRGTPGYIMVSATNESDVRLIQELNGQPLFHKYNKGNYFGGHIHRYIYNHGFSTKGLTDFSFEIDDNGHPFWVVTVFERRVGFAGDDAVGVITLDAQNGNLKFYNINEAPTWIDRIQPEDIIISQINDWGKFVHGWWNPSDLEKLAATPGTSLVFGDDGQCYWYTGITSVGSDEGTVGFMLINTRTKEVRYYNQPGATETAAMGSARGAVQDKEYTSSFPILYNVSGNPTYFITLKDRAGLVKMMAFVSVENYQIVGVGDNLHNALREYRRALSGRGNMIAPDAGVSFREAEGSIQRFGMEVSQNSVYYYLIIKGFENKLFVGSSDISV